VAITITNLKKISDQYAIDNFVYSDLHLDLSTKGNFVPELNNNIDQVDLKVDYDKSAIINSLKNLFNTKPGQRILFPEYGLDLHKYLFEAITETNAQALGEKITRGVRQYEPRVILKQCNIELFPEDQQYEITLIVEFPIFNTIQTLNSTLDAKSQSFIFAESSRNI
jgi:uncharacterized protein